MNRIAVVEDELLTRRAIGAALREHGFEVHPAADAFACRTLLRTTPIDLVVLDLGLPGVSGMEFARELRNAGNIGLVIVTRRDEAESRIQALDIGADDYLTKPVHFGELAARIRSVLRRRQVRMGTRATLGRWIVDLDARSVTSGETVISLTRGEFDILAQLIHAGGKIVSREDLLATISRRPNEADLRSVDALISRLRRKLDGETDMRQTIVTAPGFGYRLFAAAKVT